MLDEKSLRRPDFRGGVTVRLADGQEWVLAQPSALFVPDDSEDQFRIEWNLGPRYGDLLEASDQAARSGDGYAIIRAELAIARFLVELNYSLTTTELAQLLRFGYGESVDPETRDMMAAIRDIAVGRVPAPKAPRDGSG